ncbi:MAG TPA: hypothetical protein VF138_11655 [Caulobacteraceae bacterium]
MKRTFLAVLLASAIAAPAADAQVITGEQQVTVAVNPAALPPPDPQAWWTDKWPAKPDAANPLRRRIRRGEHPPAENIQNGVQPLLYRLWRLPPLQDQLVRRGEAVVEMWARPAETVRQAVVRVTLRGDGRAFVQGRAGLGCCEPEIERLMWFDEELSVDRAAAVRAVINDPLWNQPGWAEVVEDGMTVDPLCVNGVAYDVSLVLPNGARSLHRACSGEQVGSIAPVLTALLSAALGYDQRFDVVFPRGVGAFAADRADYEALLARGGQLQPARNDRVQPNLVLQPDPADIDPAPLDAPAMPTTP